MSRRLAWDSADDMCTFSTTMVDKPVTAAAAPSPIPAAESPRLRPAVKGARRNAGGGSYHMGDGAVTVHLVNIVCELMELSYALLQLLFYLRKLLQKPLLFLLVFLEPVLVLPSQVCLQLDQTFTEYICLFPVTMNIKALERQFACL